jgi:hypothetical protein
VHLSSLCDEAEMPALSQALPSVGS